jgi:hypothetical protein
MGQALVTIVEKTRARTQSSGNRESIWIDAAWR